VNLTKNYGGIVIRGKIFLIAILLILLLMLVPYLPIFKTAESRQAPYDDTPPDEMVEEIDTDGDLLKNNDEFNITGTDPGVADTDNDGMLDGEEYEYWDERYDKAKDKDVPDWIAEKHPYLTEKEQKGLYQSTGDLDGDGYSNINDRDADNDGLSDGFEVKNDLDPADPNSNYDDLSDDKKSYIPKKGSSGAGIVSYPNGENVYTINHELVDDVTSYNKILFKVTPSSNPRYWRTAVYDSYRYGTWSTSSNFKSFTPYSGEELAYNVTTFDESSEFNYTITFEGMLRGMIPNALYTTSMYSINPDSDLRYNKIGTFETNPNQLIKSYSFNTTVYTYEPEQLLSAVVPATLENKNIVESNYIIDPIADLGRELAAGKSSDFEKAYAIAKYLISNYIYDLNSYSYNRDYSDYYLDNENKEVRLYIDYDKVLYNMLFHTYHGRCIDFASAFVLMCRANGIPAVMTAGFAPGDIEDSGSNERVVRVGHGHTWGEILLTGVGWLPFEVTPNRAVFGNTTGVHSSGTDASIITAPSFGDDTSLDYEFNGTGGGTTTNIYFDILERINHTKMDSDNDGAVNADDPDDDNDGLTDTEEIELGTDPFKKDTDGDGITDFDEVTKTNTSPLNSDTDSDGLTDYFELTKSETDPLESDTDGGGALDGQEVTMGGDPNDDSDDEKFIDSDNDGLSNAKEKEIGTNPYDPDTDGGGATDGAEVSAKSKNLNPVDNPADDLQVLDSDHDGLMDSKELEEGTDRFDADTDDGGLLDGIEYVYNKTYNYDLDLLNGSDDYWLMDDDGDGLSNIQEDTNKNYQVDFGETNPNDDDSDGGGVPDGIETKHGFDPTDGSDDAGIDSDGDGISDVDENEIYGTNPYRRDTDSDGIDDAEEIYAGKDGYVTSATYPDTDGDGLSDGQEIEFGTNPTEWDSDYDGLSDLDEILRFTDPNNEDTDGDGINDGPEVNTFFSDPTFQDSDGDGIDDWLEINRYKSDPVNMDSDGDGILDGFEVEAGSSPTDYDDRPSPDDLKNNGNSNDRLKPEIDPVRPDPDDPRYDPNIHDPTNNPSTPSTPNVGNPSTGGGGDITSILPVLIGLILVVIILLFYLHWRKQHIEEIADVAERTEKRLSLVPETEVDSIRRAIYEAYRAMLKVMRKYDFVREKSMTPLEFEKVIAEALPISDRNLSELTRIFEEARYSDHKLDTHIRDRAINCFRELKNELRGIDLSSESKAEAESAIAG
jgi:transglutaminase-like putative cysteine protease